MATYTTFDIHQIMAARAGLQAVYLNEDGTLYKTPVEGFALVDAVAWECGTEFTRSSIVLPLVYGENSELVPESVSETSNYLGVQCPEDSDDVWDAEIARRKSK